MVAELTNASLKNVDLYNKEREWMGRAIEIIRPQPRVLFSEQRSLGYAFRFVLPKGLEQPSAIFIWDEWQSVRVIFGTLIEGTYLTCEGYLSGLPSAIPFESPPFKCELAGRINQASRHFNRMELKLTYFSLVVGAEQVELFDSFQNIWRRDGRDVI